MSSASFTCGSSDPADVLNMNISKIDLLIDLLDHGASCSGEIRGRAIEGLSWILKEVRNDLETLMDGGES